MTTKQKRLKGRTWGSAAAQSTTSLVLEPTTADDPNATLWIAAPTDGPGASLDPQQMRELAVELVHRADLIDPPKRSRWRESPTTPAGVIADYLRVAKVNMDRIWDTEGDELRHRHNRIVASFVTVALMAELDKVASDRAADTAVMIAAACDDGGSVHDWLWEWYRDYRAGKPVGFNPPATLDLEVTRDA